MKKVTSILFIAVLLFMQYSKQFAYLSCKLENINASKNCNCETILTETNQQNTNADLPIEKHNHSVITEEYVPIKTLTTTPLTCQLIINKPAAYKIPFQLQSYISSILRPPAIV